MAEPLVLVKDKEGTIRYFSNVCTHRGNLVVNDPGRVRALICSYHGRRFDLDGSLITMPEFQDAENFPRPCDGLHEFPLLKWGPFLFAGLSAHFPMNSIIGQMNDRVGFLPLDQFKKEESHSKDYIVNAHWALYCDNYLEGFLHTYVYDESKLNNGTGAVIDKVEREDEWVAEGVQRGIRSAFYSSGRFSPTREQGVHQFHQLLVNKPLKQDRNDQKRKKKHSENDFPLTSQPLPGGT